MTMRRHVLVGAVIYDPKVVLIWDIIKDFFIGEECAIDYVFYSNYSLLVDALLAGHVDIAWNSPLGWLDAARRTGGRCRAIAMRDTDRDRRSHLIVRKEGGIARLDDLRGRTLATGAKDSPQATLLPLDMLRKAGLDAAGAVRVRNFDRLVGKHGDHVGGELEALRSVQQGESDACAVLDLNWDRWTTDGTASASNLSILATTEPFDHCNFTVLADFPSEEERRWTDALFSMRYDNPSHREMMDMEGLRAWLPGRTSGYAPLAEAVRAQRYFEVT
jgi:ABC-type phosphate/phosphonate transport system substrate-binding protein